MSASPFRSHLLQQWARNSQGRAPAAVIPWLKPSSSSLHHPQEIDRGEEDEIKLSERARLARRHSRNVHVSPPSLSTLDSASTAAFAAAKSSASSSSSLWAHPSPKQAVTSPPKSATRSQSRAYNTSSNTVISAELEGEYRGTHRRRRSTRQTRSGHNAAATSSSSSNQEQHQAFGNDHTGLTEKEKSITTDSELAVALQSLLKSRRTATRLQSVGTSEDQDDELQQQQQQMLLLALDRAIECAQMAPNHKRTEPFSFRRFLAGSQAAQQLADIAYEVTLRKTDSHPNAESKRQKWLQIPAFLVTLVHDNHKDIIGDTETSLDSDPYQALPYMPPESEKQLEDYAAASAAVQNVLLSLHAEGIGSKWATGPVIRTPAFRQLIQALPTDRIAALIMLGGSTEFVSEREAQITAARRGRRRSIHGDLVVDLS